LKIIDHFKKQTGDGGFVKITILHLTFWVAASHFVLLAMTVFVSFLPNFPHRHCNDGVLLVFYQTSHVVIAMTVFCWFFTKFPASSLRGAQRRGNPGKRFRRTKLIN
jgi:hypothetical protein